MRILLFSLLLVLSGSIDSTTPFEKSNGLESATYDEAISYYRQLDSTYSEIKLLEYGPTDVGRPLHLVVISSDGEFNPQKIEESGRRILLVNNAIHPGEPCGVDASMMLARDLMEKKEMQRLLQNVVVCIIPFYNIGGALNRGCCSRANQVGPKEYGFRGNARNLDLNRDFIKADSRNARSFAEIFDDWKPDIFVDTHTSNGADYQHVMTLISTQKDKLHPVLATYLEKDLEPALYKRMAQKGFPMTPYVNTLATIPDSGLVAYLETPRYSTGYAALFNCIGFTSEAHMWKPYKERVEGTYHFLESLLEKMNINHKEIGLLKAKADLLSSRQKNFPLRWELDTSQKKDIIFQGYEATWKESKVTGTKVESYDRERPYQRNIPFYNSYKSMDSVTAPVAYLIPQAWQEVTERLMISGIRLKQLLRDTVLEVEYYRITRYDTRPRPYEGHYLNYDIETSVHTGEITFYQGDYVAYVNQPANRFIVETLEPRAPDSYFAWNFFDAVLSQKEYFSPYIFDETAHRMLQQNATLKREFEQRKEQDSMFAKSPWAQWYFIYQQSELYEPSHNRYPVYRLITDALLPLRE
ncbi:MAG: M14 family metallopeptidase [Bacteroidia bacterium]